MEAPPKELYFPQDHSLYAVQCLRQYEKVTKNIRPRDSSEANSLFLSHIKLHHPITSKRVAHWIGYFGGGRCWYKHLLSARSINHSGYDEGRIPSGHSPYCRLEYWIHPHFRDFTIDLKRRMSMLAPYWTLRTRKVVSLMGICTLRHIWTLCHCWLCIYTCIWPRRSTLKPIWTQCHWWWCIIYLYLAWRCHGNHQIIESGGWYGRVFYAIESDVLMPTV